MKNDKYKKDIDQIHARDEWKESVKQRLYQEHEQLQQAVDATATRSDNVNIRKGKRRAYRQWLTWSCSLATLATCLCIAIYVSVQTKTETIVPPESNTLVASDQQARSETMKLELEKLPVSFYGGSFGFEAFSVKDAEELQHGNPWKEASTPTSLPVYKNKAIRDGAGAFISSPQSEEQMRTTALSYVERLNFIQENEEISYGELTLLCEQGSVKVSPNGDIRIEFKPQTSSYVFHTPTSYEEAQATTTRLIKELGNMLPFTNLQPDIVLNYDIYGEQQWTLQAYEAKADPTETLISYNFNRVRFSNWENELWYVDISQYDTSKIVGEYPIISLSDAKALLANMNYISSSPTPVDHNAIAHVELVYRMDERNEVFMPYYKFYSELSDTMFENQVGGISTYGVYYVPAVASEYLLELPKADIHFN